MKRIVSLLIILSLCLVLLPIFASAVTTINSISLTLDHPEAGKTPPGTATWHGDGYSIYSIDWYDCTDGRYLESGEKIQPDHQYEATLWVMASDGYAFACENDRTPSITAVVNGEQCTATKAYEYKAFAMVCVTYRFSSTDTEFHTHFYTDWAWNSGQHYKNCTDCDEVFFVESHKGGVATCQEDGKCTVCGYAYIKASEEYHTPDTSKWVAREYMYHYHKCTLCGAHCDTEDHRWSPTYLYQDKNGHAWICADCKARSEIEPHIAGPAGTPGAEEVCRDCGYIMKPADDHKHKLTKVEQVPATCTEEGTIEYYKCSGCSDLFADAAGKTVISDTMQLSIGALGHTVSDDWSCDEQYHWRVCTTCKTVLDETKMVHTFEDGLCLTCQYQEGSTITAGPSEPADVPVNKKDPAVIIPWYIWVPVLLAVFLVIMTVTVVLVVIVVIKKRKKP